MTSNPEYRRAVRSLNALERNGELTDSGRRWLIQTVDPFHDTDQLAAGFPDAFMAPGLVQVIKKKMTIAKDAALPAGNWDCNILNLPWVDGQSLYSYNKYKNMLTGGSGAGTSTAVIGAGGIAAMQCTANGTMAFVGAGTSVDYLTLDQTFLDGPCRVVSAGFEVTNTTAEIYRQGDCTVYRVPQAQQQRCTVSIASNAAAPWTTAAVTYSAELHSRVPLTVGEAQYMTGSRTWAAHEGAYIPLTLNGLENPVREDDANGIIMIMGAESAGYTPVAATGATDAVLSPTIPSPRRCVSTPFNLGGAYFTGLSDQTTLTITVNWYVERFPTTLQAQLAVLAKPPAVYDPLAFDLYTRMLKQMPVGVMVKENGLGQWFADVVGSVAPFAEGILGAIPHPYAQVGAQAARIAGKMADKYRVAPGEKGDAMRASIKKQRKKAKKAGKSAGKALKPKSSQ